MVVSPWFMRNAVVGTECMAVKNRSYIRLLFRFIGNWHLDARDLLCSHPTAGPLLLLGSPCEDERFVRSELRE
jgi:hypothetical protein